MEPTGRSVDGVSGEPGASGEGGAARIGKKMPVRDWAHKGGCISNDLLKKSLKVVSRGLWV